MGSSDRCYTKAGQPLVQRTQMGTTRQGGLSRRTQIVWLSFIAAMTLVIGVLALGEGGFAGAGLVAMQVSPFDSAEPAGDQLFRTTVPLRRKIWEGIVIHHLGQPAGDAQSVHRLHQSYGHTGLGYHFLIGNGNGLGDGVIEVGYRWNDQQPGAHIAQSAADDRHLNEHTIGICLIGNGDRRPFTDRQMQALVALVRALQQELDLPADAVSLHRELAPEVGSPGRFFAEARLRQQLLP